VSCERPHVARRTYLLSANTKNFNLYGLGMFNNPSCLRARHIFATRTKTVIALITTSIVFWYFLDDFLAEREEIVN
jgi:hypothetical protein